MKLTDKQKTQLRGLADITVECLPEDLQIEGNASAIDPETDAQVVKDIREQLESGNEWAWCCVRVTVKWGYFEGTDYLGGCSYKGLKEFHDNQYYVDMVSQAFDDLVRNIESTSDEIDTLEDL